MGFAFSRLILYFRAQAREFESEKKKRKREKEEEEEEEEGLEMQLRSRSTERPRGEQVQRSRKRQRTISTCTSPRSGFLFHCSEFNWYEEDIWTEVAKYLDGRDLVRLGMTNRWFNRLIMKESIWKFACLRDLHVPQPRHVSFSWLHLYTSAFDGSHSYSLSQQEKHIDWMRIGAFYFDSSVALLSENLCMPKRLPKIQDDPEKCIQTSGTCLLTNIKTGIWIADLQLVRCPVCNLNSCEGTMQILDARHAELFLEEGYKNGSWEYTDIGSRRTEKPCNAAAGIIFDLKHLKSPCTADLLDGSKHWVGGPNDWQPKSRLCLHAVAVNTNLQPNEGLCVKFQAMRSGGENGEVVSIRISQQLI